MSIAGAVFVLFATLASGFLDPPTDVIVYDGVLNHSACSGLVNEARARMNDSALSISGAEASEWSHWDAVLYNAFSTAIQRYVQSFASSPHTIPFVRGDSGYVLVRYTSSMGPQIDAFAYPPAIVSAVMMLNDDVGGGDFRMPRQQWTTSPTCGRVVMFPSTFTHPWSMTPVRIGELFYVVTSFR